MIKKYLISTNIKETWPENEKDHLIFINESALNKYPDKNFYYKNFDINKYHWKDKQNLIQDFIYLEKTYENILEKLKIFLNNHHGLNYPTMFWRILIGPWLGTLIFIFFDRWKNLKTSLNDHSVDKAISLKFNSEIFIPYEAEDFITFTQNDLWNQNIYQSMYNDFLSHEKIDYFELSNEKIEILKESYRQKKDKKKFLTNLIFTIFKFFQKKKYKYLIYNSYIGSINEFKLSLSLWQIPIFKIFKNKYKTNTKIDYIARKKISEITSENEFEKIFLKNLKNHIPKVFLENFEDLKNYSEYANLPQQPKKIISANALWYDSFFMFHSARLKMHKTQIIYGQHGGAYGLAEYSWPEEHEKKISDKYLTWGWSGKKSENNVKKFFILLKNKRYNWNKEKKNLLVLMRHRKVYFQSPETSAGSELYSDYIKYCSLFLNSISEKIKSNTVLRLPLKNLKPSSIDFFSNLENSFKFDSSPSFENACNESKIILNTSNSTTFCETIGNNIPSILLINKNNNPFRENALEIIKLLEKNNMIFFDPIKASSFIDNIWDNKVKNWWFKKETQEAAQKFRSLYANRSENIVKDLKNIIEND